MTAGAKPFTTIEMVRTILERLGLVDSDSVPATPAAALAVDKIASRLEHLPADRARFVVAFAMVLARVARADLEVSTDERHRIVEILKRRADLPKEQADTVVELVVHHNELGGVSDEYIATRELKKLASNRDREWLLRCLFALCAADDSITVVEEEEVRQIVSELGFTHREYTEARAAFRDYREVLRGIRRD
jgi:uncharacterized tellurite resistance protein B-like protein